MHATRSLADTQATISTGFGWRSFHDDSEATKEARLEA